MQRNVPAQFHVVVPEQGGSVVSYLLGWIARLSWHSAT